MTDAVVVSIDEGVAQVRLNRPDAYNAIGSEMIEGLLSVGAQIEADASVRVVVLSGEGRGFCAGLDMANFGDMMSGDLTADSAADAYDDLSPAGANMVQQLGWIYR
jgi:enoyl-CoA hydratase/carnithine racemase